MESKKIFPRILILVAIILVIFLIAFLNKGEIFQKEEIKKCFDLGYSWDYGNEKCVKIGGRQYCSEIVIYVKNCIEIYQPVCGWFDTERIRCNSYPCAKTFSNACFACSNKNVFYYTEGECPR